VTQARSTITATFEMRTYDDLPAVRQWLKESLRRRGLKCLSITDRPSNTDLVREQLASAPYVPPPQAAKHPQTPLQRDRQEPRP